MHLSGNTRGFNPSTLKKLKKLSERRVGKDSYVTPELARQMCELCAETGRMIGLLVDRRGEVTHVIAGDPTRLYLPDIGRLRAGGGRLRGLRLIVVKLSRLLSHNNRSPSGVICLDRDFVTDLEKLQLDAVVEIEALPSGLAGRVVVGTLSPVVLFEKGEQYRHKETHYKNLGLLDDQFAEQILELENQLIREEALTKKRSAVQNEREVAMLVGVYTTPKDIFEPSMNELAELAKTARVRVVGKAVQRRKQMDPRTLVGKGKLEEICLEALHKGAQMLIFDCDLSPSQLSAITDATDLKVLDRTMLILDIFAQRAKSRGGKLQVELAQLKYSLPRLSQKQSGLSRLTGGIGGQGPGETKLEIDKRRAKDRITRLERDIEKLRLERQVTRQRRLSRDVPVIAIVGYTNAGKSTLLNRLTGADVYAENELFATLDPTSRRLRFPKEREVILVDTVGFIRDLPEGLINAFRATLEELHEADVLLHVVDATDSMRKEHVLVVERILADLKIDEPRRVLVLNKCDLLPEEEALERALNMDALAVSARSGQGFEALVSRLFIGAFG